MSDAKYPTGTRICTRIADCDTDERGIERPIPIGTLGTVQDLNHIDRDGIPNHNILWDNGGWTVWSDTELDKDAEIVPKPPLPPDPDGLNEARADRARRALDTFMAVANTDRADAICDLIANLRHLCDRDDSFGTFASGIARAERCYQNETSTEQ